MVVGTGLGAVEDALRAAAALLRREPAAAESLGVNVYRYKYIAVSVSGAFAGIGGRFLTLVSSSGFTSGADRTAAATSAWRR